MSAKDRARQRAEQRERKLVASAIEGIRQCLDSPDGRAFLWWFYADNADAEGQGSKGRRMVAREILKAARVANFEGLQIMREEWEKPRMRAPDEPEPEAESEFE